MATAVELEVEIRLEVEAFARELRECLEAVNVAFYGAGIAYGLLGPASEAELVPFDPARWGW